VLRWILASLLCLGAVTTAAAQGAGDSTVVILVRHAEKGGNPLSGNPSLTPAGRQRALALYQAVKGRHVDAIVTTQLRRTQQTAMPTADSLHVTPRVINMWGRGDANAAATAELIRHDYAGKTVLVVGHQTTVPRILKDLGGPAFGDICSPAYGYMFVLVLHAATPPTLTRLHYGADDPPGRAECTEGIHR